MRLKRTNLFFAAALLIWLLADAQRVRESASDALKLCAASVIPALFPFLVVTGLLMSLGFGAWASPLLSPLMGLYRLPGAAGSALLLGFLGGYPVGARTAADLCRLGLLTKNETERLLAFCNNANPAFLISVLGVGVFHSVRTGVCLLLIHVLSALLTGLCFRGPSAACHAASASSVKASVRDAPSLSHSAACYAPSLSRNAPPSVRDAPPTLPDAPPPVRDTPPTLPDAPPAFFTAFADAVGNAASAILKVCAFVTFFFVLSAPLKRWNCPAAAPLVGTLELFSLTPLLTPDCHGFVLASVCAGWGGASALGQTAAVLQDTGLSVRSCLAGKLVQALFSGILAALAWKLLL